MKHNWEYRRLGDIAPAKPFKGTITSSNDKYWCLNLDKVESNTGKGIKEVVNQINKF